MLGYDWPQVHAALNDLPTALLLTAVIFDLLALATRRDGFRLVSFWTMVAGAIGGALAALSGLQAEDHIEHGEAVHRVMETHEELALITLGVFGLLTLWRIVRQRKMAGAERGVFLLFSLAGLAVLFVTANYGGRLIFEHAAAVPSRVLQAELRERTQDHHHGLAPAQLMERDSAAPSAGHVDPPGTPPHTHPSGTPPHQD